MREIVLDTETTGIDPEEGHKIIEIGCVELLNHMPTGRTYHVYINPEREIEADAIAVHGITNEKVKNQPVFAEIVGEFLDFIEGGKLVIHNAEFDIKFLNAELKPLGYKAFKLVDVIDTLPMARKKYPGQPANLDALCRRFGVDLSGREFHGALLDSQLLAAVYLELLGGRQHGLGLDASLTNTTTANIETMSAALNKKRELRPARSFLPSEQEIQAHSEMLEKLKGHHWPSTITHGVEE